METAGDEVSFDSLIAAARQENWDFVDANLPGHANDAALLGQAAQHLSDNDANVRDLAASTFEASSLKPDEEATERLTTMLRETDDNPFPRFRAACALFKHGDRSSEVVSVLESFEHHEDEEVAAIAHGYLTQLDSKKD